MFSFCKLVDKPQRQNLGMEKFEMLCILAFNKVFVKEFDTDNSLSLDAVVESLGSAASPAAAKILTQFFDVDVEWESSGYGDSAAVAQLVK